MKTCSKCQTSKEESEFYLDNRRKTGRLYAHCKLCQNALTNAWSEEHKEQHRELQATWRGENKERAKETEARRKASFSPERIAEDKAARALYDKNNRDRVNAREKKRLEEDPRYKISKTLRRRISVALTRVGLSKNKKTKELIGCPVVWLEAWIESQFRPGMSWENHGTVWELDHIKPCAAFDLTDPEQQKMCFHWSNQQPLFAQENRSKGARYDGC